MKVRVAISVGSNLVFRDVEWSDLPRPGEFISPGPCAAGANIGATVRDLYWQPLAEDGIDANLTATCHAESPEEADKYAATLKELGWKDWSETMKGRPKAEFF